MEGASPVPASFYSKMTLPERSKTDTSSNLVSVLFIPSQAGFFSLLGNNVHFLVKSERKNFSVITLIF